MGHQIYDRKFISSMRWTFFFLLGSICLIEDVLKPSGLNRKLLEICKI
jgi:hypothetical protein